MVHHCGYFAILSGLGHLETKLTNSNHHKPRADLRFYDSRGVGLV
jgi:hypothetical protein